MKAWIEHYGDGSAALRVRVRRLHVTFSTDSDRRGYGARLRWLSR